MLRTIRLTLAIVFFALVTLLFLDFTGTLHGWMGWMAKIQFLPALLALNAGVILLLVALTLLFGRVYCSVICPLGVFQDVISRFAGKRKKNRFRYSPARKWLRYGMLAVFAVTLIAGVRFHAVASLLEPYSSYGRIASSLFAPVYQWGNNLLAYLAERVDSYAFYETEVWMKSLPTFIIAALTFVVLIILAWRGGRTYCKHDLSGRYGALVLLRVFSFQTGHRYREVATAADFAHATARHRASIPKPTKLITAVAWHAWTAWINADREPSPTPAAVIKRMLRKYPPGIRLNVQQLLPDRQMIPGAHFSRQRQYWPLPPL